MRSRCTYGRESVATERFKHRDTLEVFVRALVAPKQAWKEARKAVCISQEPVPQTDTGRQEEDSKANGRRVVKELGKLTP